MFWLAAVLPIAYIPGITGFEMLTGWAVLSASLPFLIKSGRSVPELIFNLAVWFLAYAWISLFWANNPITGLSEIWYLALMAGAFYVGSQLTDLHRVAKGLALGFGISSVFSIAQTFGLDLIPEFVPCRPSGLDFNPVVMGEGCALTILLLLAYRSYGLAAMLVPGLLLTQSRGALLALVLGVVALYCKPQRSCFYSAPIWAACPTLTSYTELIAHNESDGFRWMIWRTLYHFLTLWGHGAGAIESVVIVFRGHLYLPGYAHNEFLDLAYQFGVGALPAFALLLLPLLQTKRLEWPCYVGFIVCAVFSFPFHSPPLAFAGMVVAGSLCRDWSWVRNSVYIGGFRFALRLYDERAGNPAMAV